MGKIIGINNKKSEDNYFNAYVTKLEEGNYLGALLNLKNYAEDSGVPSEDLFADIYFKIGLYDKAMEYWMKYFSHAKTKQQYAKAFCGMGAAQYKLGFYYMAVLLFSWRLKLDETGDNKYDYLVEECLRKYLEEGQKKNKEEEKYNGFLNITEENKKRFVFGALMTAMDKLDKNHDELLDYAKQLEMTEEERKSMIAYYAEECLSNKKIKFAKDCIDYLISMYPDEFLFKCLYVRVYDNIEDKPAKYNEMLDGLFEYDDKELDNNMNKIEILVDHGDIETVIKIADRWIEDDPFNLVVREIKGTAEYNLGKVHEAYKSFQYIYQINDSIEVYSKLSECKKILDGKKGFEKKLEYNDYMVYKYESRIGNAINKMMNEFILPSENKCQELIKFFKYRFVIGDDPENEAVAFYLFTHLYYLFGERPDLLDDMVRELLVNCDVPSGSKSAVIRNIVELGVGGDYLVSEGHELFVVRIPKVEFRNGKYENEFMDAFSRLVGDYYSLPIDFNVLKKIALELFEFTCNNKSLRITDVGVLYDFIFSMYPFRGDFTPVEKSRKVKNMEKSFSNAGFDVNKFKKCKTKECDTLYDYAIKKLKEGKKQ